MSFNMVKFIARSADFMTRDRPDIWPSQEEAIRVVQSWVEEIRKGAVDGQGPHSISSGGFCLTGYLDEDTHEFVMSRNICEFNYFPDEDDDSYFSWAKGGKVVGIGPFSDDD